MRCGERFFVWFVSDCNISLFKVDSEKVIFFRELCRFPENGKLILKSVKNSDDTSKKEKKSCEFKSGWQIWSENEFIKLASLLSGCSGSGLYSPF